MPLSAELLANNGIDTILTLNQIQLANHIESMRNGWMTLAQDGLTSKKVYARVTKMKFERRALCCVCAKTTCFALSSRYHFLPFRAAAFGSLPSPRLQDKDGTRTTWLFASHTTQECSSRTEPSAI